ncbi:MAG: hypothetical protein KAT70_02295 [Thermoplasmata archaeon]|nr:hypothetical protein [Thermoplasmata archaeon]
MRIILAMIICVGVGVAVGNWLGVRRVRIELEKAIKALPGSSGSGITDSG